MTAQLIELKIPVHTCDILKPRPEFREMHVGEVGFHTCDISNREAVSQLMKRVQPDTVFHPASIVDLRANPSPALEAVNLNGTANITEALSSLPGKRRLVYTSSIDVVCPSYWGYAGADESTPYAAHPTNDYKRTKILAEKHVLEHHNPPQLATCALRPGHLFGPWDVLMPFCSRSPVAVGSAGSRMSFSYIENVARAHILAAAQLSAEQCGGAVLCGGTATFLVDYNVNLCDYYRVLAGRKPAWIRLHWALLVVLVFLVEAVSRLVFALTSRRIQHPMTGMTTETLAACSDVTALRDGAVRKLGYLQGEHWIGREEAERRTLAAFDSRAYM